MESRRDFLKRTSFVLAIPLVLGYRADSPVVAGDRTVLDAIRKNAIRDPRNDWWGALDTPDTVSNRLVLASGAEKAERIKINGTVYQADGKTPAPNVLIYFYHTNVHGVYGRRGEHKHGKFRGWLLTGPDGRYEFETIKPASYPDSTIAAHIHMTVTGVTFKEDWIDSIHFEGDRFLTERERKIGRGGFNGVLSLKPGAKGISEGVRDIKLLA